MLVGIKSVICQESLLIPVFLYGLIKLLLPSAESDGDLKKIVVNVVRPLLALILTGPLFTVLCLCACYFEIARILAKLKYSNRYVEHFLGADAVWSYDQRIGSSVITQVSLFEDQGPDTPERIYNFFRAKHVEVIKTHPRFGCIRESFMGYFYFIKENVDIDEIFVYLDDYQNYNEFHSIVTELSSKSMPCGGKYMMQICFGKTLIEVEPGRFVYPVITRSHHSIMDGVTKTAFICTSYVNNGYNVTKDMFNDLLKMFKQEAYIQKQRNEHVEKKSSLWDRILNKNVYFHHNVLQHVEPENVLHHGPISTKKVLKLKLEGPDGKYFDKVKEIKKHLNVSHSDVVLGAVAASLTEYYATHDLTHPSFISTGTTFFLKGIDFNDLVQMHDNQPITNLGNKFTVGHSKIPLNAEFLNDPKQFVHALYQQSTSLRKALDMLFFYWILNINCTIVPQALASPILDLFDCTTITTNVPGTGDLVFSNGSKLVDAWAWSIHYKQIGVCIGIYTFNNRLRITLHVDEQFLKNEDNGQEICENFFKYIDKIYESL